jgi:hypothetical protein
LLGPFLGAGLGAGEKLVTSAEWRRYANLDSEYLAMIGPFFFHNRITRVRPASGVNYLLQS